MVRTVQALKNVKKKPLIDKTEKLGHEAKSFLTTRLTVMTIQKRGESLNSMILTLGWIPGIWIL